MNIRIIVAGLFAATATLSFATDWDLVQDFSTSVNPNGAWNYGRYDGGGLFTNNDTAGTFFGFATGWLGDGGDGRPFVGINDTGDVAGSTLGQVVLHPDYAGAASPYAGVHWVSPIDGTIDVSGKFWAGDAGSVSIYASIDRTSYFFAQTDVADDYTFSFQQNVVAGDFLDFFIGPNSGGDPSFGTTPLDLHIATTAVPEPASCAALGLGIVAVLKRRKRSAN